MKDDSNGVYATDAGEQLRRWDSGDPIWTIEMGGMGPGYEQAIQVLAIEIVRDEINKPLPTEVQPRLFDRGTGTHGPALAAAPLSIPLPAVAIGRQPRPGQIPANIAVREILAFIKADPSTANWGDQSVQDLASTVIIAAYKAGHVGLWERQS